MHRLIVTALAVAFSMVAKVAWSQTPPSNNVVTYFNAPLEHDALRLVMLRSVTIPAGGGSTFHRHPGDQWYVVEEGEWTFIVKGQPDRVLRAGDNVFIPRGTVHRTQNAGDKPTRAIEFMILDKDKPPTERVE
jgi:quercetin dioxygenase-like cupin family protein